MYEAFYGLKADPFRLSPDHRFCYRHPSYARAKAYVEYALHRAEGFVLITGRPGTGKTTLVNDLLATLPSHQVVAGTLVSTQLEAEDLLLMTGHAFGLDFPRTQKALVLQRIIDFLHQQHRQGLRTLLIIDEAQDLTPSALEELRLLTNLQQGDSQLLQIVLLGQEQLRDMMRAPAMEQVRQRLIAAWRLEPLNPEETVGYVRHRLERAGWTGDPAFEPGVLDVVQRFSKGVPRRINTICGRLLLHGYMHDRHTLTPDDAGTVTAELYREELAVPDDAEDEAGSLPGAHPWRAGYAESGKRHEDIWAEIDRGLFGAVQPASSRGVEPGSARVGDATTAVSGIPGRPSGGLGASRQREFPPTHRGAPEPDHAPVGLSAAAAPPVHIVPEKEEHWSAEGRPREDSSGRASFFAGSPWLWRTIVALSIVWAALLLLFLFSRGIEGTPMSAVERWWAQQVEVASEEDAGAGERVPGPGEEAMVLADKEAPGIVSPEEGRANSADPEAEDITLDVPSRAEGEPAAAAAPIQSAKVLFGLNSVTVDARFGPMLDEVAAALLESRDSFAEIIGYTDHFGSLDYNLRLSRQRAQAVADHLIERGVSAERLRSRGEGPREVDSEWDGSREEKRMVEVRVLYPPYGGGVQ